MPEEQASTSRGRGRLRPRHLAVMRARGRLLPAAAACLAACLVLLVTVAAAGTSAAEPGLGPAARYPPWSLQLGWGPGLVTALLAAAYLLGASGLACGLVAVRQGARISPRTLTVAALCVVAVVAVVPPTGSADHLSYAAYGRIAAEGGDPYVERPTRWHGGSDPVASASQPPWSGTRSVYGPVATAVQAGASLVGGDSVRLTVWVLHLLVVAAFALTAWLLDRLARHAAPGSARAAARTRVGLLWTLNPFVLGPAVLGSHVDVLGAALVVATLALLTRVPLLAGVALGAAVGIKLPFAVAALAVVWGLRRLPLREALRVAVLVLLGAAAVLVPAHEWAGEHVYDQVERARRYVSLASPWRPVVDLLDAGYGTETVRAAVGPASLVAAALVALAVCGLVRHAPVPAPEAVTSSAVRAMAAVAAGWLFVAPYALPWYDVLLWAPLALVGAGAADSEGLVRHGWVLDGAVLARAVVLALAYVPGRAVGLSPPVEHLTLGFRAGVAPWLVTAVLVWLVAGTAVRRPAGRRYRAARPPARAFARSPR